MFHIYFTEIYTFMGKFTQWSRAMVWAEHPGFILSSVTDSLQKPGETMCPSKQNGDNNHSYQTDVQ